MIISIASCSFGRLTVMGVIAFLRRADDKSHDLPTLISNISRTMRARRLQFTRFAQFFEQIQKNYISA
jgi:hypothetical protein